MNVMNDSPRRKELTRLAAQLFVQEGFDRTTVRMLAQEMGIKSGSLFHHFRDKQEILAAVIEEGTQNALTLARAALKDSAPDPLSRLHAMARAHLDTLLTDRNAHVVALYEWRRLDDGARDHLTHLRDAYEALWNGRTFMVQDTGGWEQDAKGMHRSIARGVVRAPPGEGRGAGHGGHAAAAGEEGASRGAPGGGAGARDKTSRRRVCPDARAGPGAA